MDKLPAPVNYCRPPIRPGHSLQPITIHVPRTNKMWSSTKHGELNFRKEGKRWDDDDYFSADLRIYRVREKERGRGGEEFFASLLRRILLAGRFSGNVRMQANDRWAWASAWNNTRTFVGQRRFTICSYHHLEITTQPIKLTVERCS